MSIRGDLDSALMYTMQVDVVVGFCEVLIRRWKPAVRKSYCLHLPGWKWNLWHQPTNQHFAKTQDNIIIILKALKILKLTKMQVVFGFGQREIITKYLFVLQSNANIY